MQKGEDRSSASGRQTTMIKTLWERIPGAIRGLGILAVILDVLVLPVVMVREKLGYWTDPVTAWLAISRQMAVWHLTEGIALALMAGAIYGGWTLEKQWGSDSSTVLGSARWRDRSTFADSWQRWTWRGTHNPAGIVVGADAESGPVRSAWVHGKDGHHIIIGAPGSGKSLKTILPSLAVIAEQGEGLVITDPKGELYQAIAGYLQQRGYTISVLNLRNPTQSVRWNPLVPIRHALDHQRWADATQMASDLATLLTASSAPTGDAGAFWQNSARAITTALALLVADQAPPESRHLPTMYHLLTQQGSALDALMDQLPPTHPARQAFAPARIGSADTRQNQLAVVVSSLSLLADPNIAWITSGHEIDMAQLGQGHYAVFLIIPDDRSTYYPLAGLFVAQLTQTLAAVAAQNPKNTLPVPVHLVLDEFGNLPKIPDFDKVVTVGRGRGINVTLVLQDFGQLDARYGHELARTMRQSCNTWLYLAANDVETARIISERIGQTTVQTLSHSRNWQSGGRSWSESTNQTARALLTPDEVMAWNPRWALVLQQGFPPAKLPARFWFDWPQSRLAGDPPAIPPRNIEWPTLWTLPLPESPESSDADTAPQTWEASF